MILEKLVGKKQILYKKYKIYKSEKYMYLHN